MRAAALFCAVVLALPLHAADATPIVFLPENLQVSLRLPRDGGAIRCDHRLTLYAELPRSGAVLRLERPQVTTVVTDTGERLGLLIRPYNRIRPLLGDRQVMRDRRLRLSFDLTPPANTACSVLGLHGSVVMALGDDDPTVTTVPLTVSAEPIAIAELDGGSVRIETVDNRRVTLQLSTALFERLSAVDFTDAAGVPTSARPASLRPLSDGSQRLTFSVDTAPTAVRLTWFPRWHNTTTIIDIPRLDVPGGIPGIGSPADPPPDKPSTAADWTPLHQAVQAGASTTVDELLARGADPWHEAADGRSAIDLAYEQSRWALLRRLLGSPP